MSWCVLPWIHVCVRPDEKIKPCCRFQLSEGEAETLPTLDTFNPNNEWWQTIRTSMLAGEKLDGCKKCHAAERIHGSMRTWMNRTFSHISESECTEDFQHVRYIEMSLDNLCNFECRMCSSKFSSKLQLRDKHMNWSVHKKLEPVFDKFNHLDLSKLEYIKLLGGEPLMSINLKPFLNYIQHRGTNLEKCSLLISTNGSKRVNKDIINLLKIFKHVEINVSLDSYTLANDYQRHGGNFIETYQNAKWYQQELPGNEINFHTTIGIYTANHLHDTLKFLIDEQKHDVSIDFIRDPLWQNISIAPDNFKQWLIDTNSSHAYSKKLIENFLQNTNYNLEEWEKLLNNTTKLDKYYNTNLQDYNPDLYQQLYG